MKIITQSVVVALLVISMVLAIKYFLYSENYMNKKETVHLKQTKDCNILKSECLFIMDTKKLRLRLSGDVRTMRPFNLEAQVQGFNSDIKTISVTFSMKAMTMGFNKFMLTKNKISDSSDNAGTDIDLWQTSILLPVCTSKRSDWQMQVRVETLTKIFEVGIPVRIN